MGGHHKFWQVRSLGLFSAKVPPVPQATQANHDTDEELALPSAHHHDHPAKKRMRVTEKPHAPVIVYSDAEYEPESERFPKLGWVLFPGGGQQPLGASNGAAEEDLEHLGQ